MAADIFCYCKIWHFLSIFSIDMRYVNYKRIIDITKNNDLQKLPTHNEKMKCETYHSHQKLEILQIKNNSNQC